MSMRSASGRPTAVAQDAPESVPPAVGDGSGTEFPLREQRLQQAAHAARRDCEECPARCLAALCDWSREVEASPDPGASPDVLLHGACVVERRRSVCSTSRSVVIGIWKLSGHPQGMSRFSSGSARTASAYSACSGRSRRLRVSFRLVLRISVNVFWTALAPNAAVESTLVDLLRQRLAAATGTAPPRGRSESPDYLC